MSLMRRTVGTKNNKGNWKRTVQFKGGASWLPKVKGAKIPLRSQHHAPVLRQKETDRECWNSVQLTEGLILEAYGPRYPAPAGNYREGDYPYDLDAAFTYDSSYMDCCKNQWELKRFNGRRYMVSVCYGESRIKIICISIDGRNYNVGDKVVLLHIRDWFPNSAVPGEPTSNTAAGIHNGLEYNRKKLGRVGVRPGKESDIVEDALDGTFVIVPFRVPGILDDQEGMIEFDSWGELGLARIHSGFIYTNYSLWYEEKGEVDVKIKEEYVKYLGVPLSYYRLFDYRPCISPEPFAYSMLDEPRLSLNMGLSGYVLVLNKKGLEEPTADDLLVFGNYFGLPIENKAGWDVVAGGSKYYPFSFWIDGRISASKYKWDCYEYGGISGQCPPDSIPFTEYPQFYDGESVELRCWSPFWCLGAPSSPPPYPDHEVWCGIHRTHNIGRGVRPPFDIHWECSLFSGEVCNTPPRIDIFAGLILGVDDDTVTGNYPLTKKGIWVGYRAQGDGAALLIYFGIGDVVIATMPILQYKYGYFRLTATVDGLLSLYTKNRYEDVWIFVGSTIFPGVEINIFYFTSYQHAEATEEASEMLAQLNCQIYFLHFIRGAPPGGQSYAYR